MGGFSLLHIELRLACRAGERRPMSGHRRRRETGIRLTTTTELSQTHFGDFFSAPRDQCPLEEAAFGAYWAGDKSRFVSQRPALDKGEDLEIL